jgi:hypothetical protein
MIKRKKASEIFGEVDPHLTVIDGGTRRRHRSMPLTQTDWDRARGVLCPRCNNETLRLINGVCPQCAREMSDEWARGQEDKTLRNYYRAKLRDGTLDLHRMREGLL